jgi:LysR family glycine cleavage system transcriptional activator
MSNLRWRLPPVNSLVAFEAACRHLSFTRAGDELGVTREAVSRHIRQLENHLATKLFVRVHRAVELTAEGRRFAAVVRRGLEDIANAAQELERQGQAPRVSVAATVAIASFWLTPRLPAFRALRADIELHVTVSDLPRDLAAENIDVGLRYGDGAWAGVDATALFTTTTYPVCSPEFLARNGPIGDAATVGEQVLLNLDGPNHTQEDWRWWLDAMGLTQSGRRMLSFDNYANIIQAALDGQGVALGFSGIISSLLDEGRLIRPIPDTLSRDLAVHLVVPSGTTISAPARAFCDWVMAEAQKASPAP